MWKVLNLIGKLTLPGLLLTDIQHVKITVDEMSESLTAPIQKGYLVFSLPGRLPEVWAKPRRKLHVTETSSYRSTTKSLHMSMWNGKQVDIRWNRCPKGEFTNQSCLTLSFGQTWAKMMSTFVYITSSNALFAQGYELPRGSKRLTNVRSIWCSWRPEVSASSGLTRVGSLFLTSFDKWLLPTVF